MLALHLFGIGLYLVLVYRPFQNLKTKLERLEHGESAAYDGSRHHNREAERKAHDNVARVRHEKRLKYKQKTALERLYILVIFPASAGFLTLIYIINLFLK